MERVFHGLRLLELCGSGAYGEVWYCEDISGRRMALKILSKKKLGSHWERELRGVRNYCRITEEHLSLLQIFHVEEDEESFFYTMEPADSLDACQYQPDTLAARLQNGPVSPNDLFRILSGIFTGIRTIHAAGFTHRDIKPDNILFVKGVPKLADIGLLSAHSVTMTQLAGTLEFIPPEERTAETAGSTDPLSRQRNDLYAFGKVIYCAATGNSPSDYPAVPKGLPLSLPLKFFLRLAFQLCRKEPEGRLDNIGDVAVEFAEIERKLLTGETFRDRLTYAVKYNLSELKNHLFRSGKIMGKFWYLMLLFLLLGGTAAYWFWKPAPPFDITKQKTKKYVHKTDKNITMDIPFHWEIMTPETLKAFVQKTPPPEETQQNYSAELLQLAQLFAQNGQGVIICNFDKAFPDQVLIAVMPGSLEPLKQIPLDECRFRLKQQYAEQMKMQLEIYDFKHTQIQGNFCIFMDFAIKQLPLRTCLYMIQSGDKIIQLTFSAGAETFAVRQQEFTAALATLKMGK
ncbi:MAG: protein kinase [Lentisphaeria bacterium]|nr:protein kinase [Lentisphaeria bacterium]